MKHTPEGVRNAVLEYLITKYGVETVKAEAARIKTEIKMKNNKRK